MDDIVKLVDLPEGTYKITLYESSKIPVGYVKLDVEYKTEFGWYLLMKLSNLMSEYGSRYIENAEEDCRKGRFRGVLEREGLIPTLKTQGS